MIRNLIYLDEPKLFSLSSQVLEGLTEYLLNEKTSSSENEENQKGPLGSGRDLANAIKSIETSVERRVLHDHAFAIFEDKLTNSSSLLDIPTGKGQAETIYAISSGSFIRVKGRVKFIDAEKLAMLLKVFNSLGESIAYVTNHEAINDQIAAFNTIKNSKNNKSKKNSFDLSLLAKGLGLHHDPKFLEHLGNVTNFGFSDQLEVQQKIDGILYTAYLKRECLRESDDLLIRKYSRNTEKSLTVLGVITQTVTNDKIEIEETDTEPENMKEALANMADHIAKMETSLSGKSSKEVIIDPIAIYVSL